MKPIYLLSLSLLFLACKPQKSVTEYKYVTKTDTLIRTQINTIYKGVTDTITIENPCDSTGIINQFYSKLILPNGTITIQSQKRSNNLIASVKINDVVSSDKSKSQSSYSERIAWKEKEVIKYRIPQWAIVTIIIESLIILLYLYIKLFK